MMSPISFCNFAIFHFFLSCLPSFPAWEPSLDVDRCPTAKQAVSGRWRLGMCKTRTASWISAIACALAATSATTHAQDMQFGLQETAPAGAPAAPPAEGPPSEALANALRLYQQEQYPEASVQFQRVVEGETQDAPANVQKAQFFLGKSLYHQRYYQSALAVFDEISEQGRNNLFFDQTLQWLAQLGSQLPEPAGIIDKIGRFGVDQLEQFNNANNADLYNQLLYLM